MKALKSHWNYRLMASIDPNGINKSVYFQVHEVYYKKGKPDGYTAKPITIGGTSIKQIQWTHGKISLAFTKPILWTGDEWPRVYEPGDEKKMVIKKKPIRKRLAKKKLVK